MIDENSAELGDDLPKIRYKNGLPFNNRVMVRIVYYCRLSTLVDFFFINVVCRWLGEEQASQLFRDP